MFGNPPRHVAPTAGRYVNHLVQAAPRWVRLGCVLGALAVDRTGASGTATDSITLAAGSANTVTVTACDLARQCTTSTASYGYTPPPPPPEKAVPVLSLAPHEGAYRPAGACVACADAMLAYATPTYVSLDVARSATLSYSSAQAAPRGLVQLDVTDNSLTPAERISLRLRRADGSYVIFVSGAQEIFYAGGGGTSRMAAQFDASALATGAYDYTAEVRSWWGEETGKYTAPGARRHDIHPTVTGSPPPPRSPPAAARRRACS